MKTGVEVPQDYKKAVEWYRKSAEQNDSRGQYALGKMFEYGLGVYQNYGKGS